MRRGARRHLLFWSVAVAGAAIDQATKSVIEAEYPEPLSEPATLLPRLLGILPHRNPGALGGLFGDHPLLLVVVSLIAMGVIVWLFVSARPQRRLTDLALGLMMAGAMGNLIDRFLIGQVRDFIKFLFWPAYPVFNLADAWLTVGVALMLVGLVFGRKSRPAPETGHPS